MSQLTGEQRCPSCGLSCLPSASHCDCGYDFVHPDLNRRARGLWRFKTRSRRTRALVLLGFLGYVAVGLSGGCAAHRRPPISRAERRLLEDAPLPYPVTVAWWDEGSVRDKDPGAYASALATVVTSSGAFSSTRYQPMSSPATADLLATSTGLHCDRAVVPLLTMVTLGIIPTVFEDEHCEGMLLRNAARSSSDSVTVEVRHKGWVVMGWGAVLVGALPGWSYGAVADDLRFAERFRLAVLQERAAVDRIAAR